MSREHIEVVRAHIGPYEGRDMAEVVRGVDLELDLDDAQALRAAVARMVQEDPVWSHVHRDIVWDASALGVAHVARGIDEVVDYWRDWAGLWESYVYRVAEYRDLGDWVLTVSDVRARGRGGIPLSLRSFQIWRVQDGRIVTMRAFPTEEEALAAIRD